MEVLILDKLLRPIDVVDKFMSIIFTEKVADQGDFELVTLSTPANKRRFVTGTWITVTDSKRVMEITTVNDATDDDGRVTLKIKGEEITRVIAARNALKAILGGVAPTWVITDTPADVMRYIFDQICRLGTVSLADIIPFLDSGTLYPPSTIPEPSFEIEWEQKPDSVLAAVKELADIFDLGFRLYRDPNLSKLYFDVYAGSDRTTAQTVHPPVIFSPDLENLQNMAEFKDVSKAFNVIRVVYVYRDEVTETDVAQTVVVSDSDLTPPEGFDRRTKTVVISNIPEEITDVTAYLEACGRDELMKTRPFAAFDGQVSRDSEYVYERDYYLGDLVEFQGNNGESAYMRVMEYIHVEDEQGQRSYPTFAIRKFNEPGTWASYKYNVDWVAMGSEEYWSTQ
jgi:hypothetical protein